MNSKYLFSWFYIIIILIVFVFAVGLYQVKNEKVETITYKDFTRTYTLLYYNDSDDEDYVFITLKQYEVDDIATVKVKKELMPSVEVDETYEFHFNYEGAIFEDSIYNIFYYMNLDKVITTALSGADQTQDSL